MIEMKFKFLMYNEMQIYIYFGNLNFSKRYITCAVYMELKLC